MNGTIVYKNAKLTSGIVDLEITDGKFSAIGKSEKDGIDLGGLEVFPGLVDLHCHGAIGHDVIGDTEHIEELAMHFASRGTTTWYPTIAGSVASIREMLSTPLRNLRGACMPGYHLEGPYLSPKKPGAMSPSEMKLPDPSDFEEFDSVKLITIAPELPGALDFIRASRAKIALGHTAADYDTATAAILAGASSLTHTFNAMPPLHHREVGVIGAAIEQNLHVQVICDGHHLHPSIVLALYRIFGRDRMMLVSDSVSGAGLPDGEYRNKAHQKRYIRNSAIYNEAGALAGSACDLFSDVLTAIQMGIPKEDAFYMASRCPADYMGIKKGRIALGYDADFLVLDAKNKLCEVVIGGACFAK